MPNLVLADGVSLEVTRPRVPRIEVERPTPDRTLLVPMRGLPGSDADATAAIAAHSADTTNVHGIPDTAALETAAASAFRALVAEGNAQAFTTAALGAHAGDTTDVHGIANTALLQTIAGAQAQVDAAIASLIGAAPALLDTWAELVSAIQADQSGLAALTTTVSGKADAAAVATALAAKADTTALTAGLATKAARTGAATSVKTASYVLASTDAGTWVVYNAAGGGSMTVPPASSTPWPVDAEVTLVQLGDGALTVLPGSGAVTIVATGALTSSAEQGAVVGLKRVGATDTWLLFGDRG